MCIYLIIFEFCFVLFVGFIGFGKFIFVVCYFKLSEIVLFDVCCEIVFDDELD